MTPPTNAVAAVLDREHVATRAFLTERGWSDALLLLRAAPIVVAVAYAPERIAAPLVIAVLDRANLELAIDAACGFLRGECDWYVACDERASRIVANLIRLAESPKGNA